MRFNTTFILSITAERITYDLVTKESPKTATPYVHKERHIQNFIITDRTDIDVSRNASTLINLIRPVLCGDDPLCRNYSYLLDVVKQNIEINNDMGEPTEETRDLALRLRSFEMLLSEIVYHLQYNSFQGSLRKVGNGFAELTEELRRFSLLDSIKKERVLIQFAKWLEFYFRNRVTLALFKTNFN